MFYADEMNILSRINLYASMIQQRQPSQWFEPMFWRVISELN